MYGGEIARRGVGMGAPRLIGYTDKLSFRPGDQVRCYVSSAPEEYSATLVRLLHGDESPAGPGFRQEVIDEVSQVTVRGTPQELVRGSYADLPLSAHSPAELSMSACVQSWLPDQEVQDIASYGREGACGWAVRLRKSKFTLDVDGDVVLQLGECERWQWYHIVASISRSSGVATLWVGEIQRGRAFKYAVTTGTVGEGGGRASGALRLATDVSCRRGTFDGRIDHPVLLSRALHDEDDVVSLRRRIAGGECTGFTIGAWNLGVGTSGNNVPDVTGNCPPGILVNGPTRGVAGANYSGRETCYRLAPDEYGACHFHRDDLDDANWSESFSVALPPGLDSGVYAVWLTSSDGEEDYLPFAVLPERNGSDRRVALLLSTMTYLVYANFTDLGKNVWSEGSYVADAQTHPYADAALARSTYQYIDDNELYGPYDLHRDGSPVVYSSAHRPILNMRPKFRYRTMGCPARFPADLYVVAWLDEIGVEVDVLTDHDLNAEGQKLLDQYSVVLSSSHHEYWTQAMLDALEGYVFTGGRFMYLGGNGLFGVVSQDPTDPDRVEVRRWGTSWPFECPPGERYHFTTGEPGGTWRNRGRPPNVLVGVGTAGAGFDRGSGYRRPTTALADRHQFVFEGLRPDEAVGEGPSLQLRWGAAGYEFDRAELELGTPARTVILGSSDRFNSSHRPMLDEELWFGNGRDGLYPNDPQVAGRPHRFVRADMAFTEYPAGGGVFAAGSIAWTSCLSGYGYKNSIAFVTENVLRAFMDDAACWDSGLRLAEE